MALAAVNGFCTVQLASSTLSLPGGSEQMVADIGGEYKDVKPADLDINGDLKCVGSINSRMHRSLCLLS